MKYTSAIIGIASFCLLFGCSSPMITADGQRVILHTQMSAAVSGCQRLGNVFGETPRTIVMGIDNRQQAVNNLRDNASKQYQADTVVLVNIDEIGPSLN